MESIGYGTLAVGLGINFVLQSTNLILLLVAVVVLLFLVFLLVHMYKSQSDSVAGDDDGQN